MKRHLSLIFTIIGILSAVIGFQFDVRWNGIVAWGLAFIFLLIAAYFTKYIPHQTKSKEQEHFEDSNGN